MVAPLLSVSPLGFPWPTLDPFLFCVHHVDDYPAGNDAQGPAGSLEGRPLGQDFEGRDGWRMYHGRSVPGFPQHPHRGFETVTIVRHGLVDHSDSRGGLARYGRGDAQWMTAGAGLVHAEMFPLVRREARNPLELFQIWLNLPAEDKLTSPHCRMLWRHTIPQWRVGDATGSGASLALYGGRLAGHCAPAPPPRSWAARPESDVVIATVRLEPGGRFTLPRAVDEDTARVLYYFAGSGLRLAGEALGEHAALQLDGSRSVELFAEHETCELLLLQGRPIGQPVAQHGPFVMNSRDELQQAYEDYRRTQFGGWPWPVDDPVQPRDAGRFARHIDGTLEHAEG